MTPDPESARIAGLLMAGRSRGYVLYDEIDRILAPGREGLTELDAILSELAKNSIEVVDEPRTEGSIPDPDFLDREEFQGRDDLAPVRMYLREVLTVPRLVPHDEKNLARQAKLGGHDGEEAAKRLIEANLWVVVATARHYLNRGLSFIDLIQEGNIGLMRAVKEYNHLREYTFLTYAIWWVRTAIRRSLDEGSLQP